MLGLLPDAAAMAHPQLPASSCCQAVSWSVKTRFDATFDAKPSQHDLSVPVSSWCAISDDVASLVDPYRLRLEPVEVVGSMDLVAHIAFEVSLTLLSWTVLRKVLGCPHDELEFVCRVSDGS